MMSKIRSVPLVPLVAAALLGVAACSAPDEPLGPVATHAVTRAAIELEPRTHRRRPRPQAVAPKPPLPPDVGTPAAAAVTNPPAGVVARVLVVSADANEAVLPAITQTLDTLGTPYTLWVARARPGALTDAVLVGPNGGNFQGVILATGSLPYTPDGGANWASALNANEWAALARFEAAYRVRQVTWYTYPTAEFGFGAPSAVDTSVSPVVGSLTAAGQAALPALAAGLRLPIRNAYTYLAAATAEAASTPLLVDGAGHALMLVRASADGRENLAMTFDGNPNLVHSLALGFSVVDWLTRGVHLGERHTYAGPQVDDLFYEDDLYPRGTYRINGREFDRARAWQAAVQRNPVFANVRLSMAYNGDGATGAYYPDSLTPAARRGQGDFYWINHTFSHADLDGVTYALARDEIGTNLTVARSLGLTRFTGLDLVTPGITGLTTANAMSAAADLGVRFVVSDTSRPDGAAPTPNTGRYNALSPAILQVPRRPTNLFYNVSTPSQWAAEYNSFYRSYWGRDLTTAQIIDYESDLLLAYLLRGENAPWMFHQPNLRTYDGTRSLLSDLLDATFAKYAALLSAPVLSPAMDALGRRVADRMAFNACGASATIVPGVSITLRATGSCRVPITGVTYGTATETYGAQRISYVPIGAGQSVVIPLR